MDTIKDRNGMNLKKQKILRNGGKNMQKNYTKRPYWSRYLDGVITHLEPDLK